MIFFGPGAFGTGFFNAGIVTSGGGSNALDFSQVNNSMYLFMLMMGL